MSWKFYDPEGKLKLITTPRPSVLGLNFIIDGGGQVLSSGQKGHITIPFDCTITEVSLLADQTGSATVDLWKDTYANFPPTEADTICGSNKPAISSSNKIKDTTLNTWTTEIIEGDVLSFVLYSNATNIQRLTVALTLLRS